jgi:hypothetical protein
MKHPLLENVKILAGENDGIAFQRQTLTYDLLYVRERTASASGARGAAGNLFYIYDSQTQSTSTISAFARFVHVTRTHIDIQPKACYHLYNRLQQQLLSHVDQSMD